MAKSEFFREGDFDYTVERVPGRRTLSIHIDAGRVRVKAPSRLKDARIREFVLSKSCWISRKLVQSARRMAEEPSHRFADGEMLPLLGKKLPLSVEVGPGRNGVSLSENGLVASLAFDSDRQSLPKIVERWYRARAREVFQDRAAHFSGMLGVTPAKITVRGQKRRWGSCSSRGNISLNWKLITGPPEILDYVVAHELCHLLHRNHGPEFWKALSGALPDFKTRRQWLKDNGHKLGL